MATNSASSLHHHTYPLSYLKHHHHHNHHHHNHHHHTTNNTTLARSFSPRPRRRRRPTRRLKKNHSANSSSTLTPELHFILAVDELKTRTPFPLQRTIDYCQSNFNQFVSSSMEAYNDLKTLVMVEPGTRRLVVSCSESTVRFAGGLVVWSCVGFAMVRVLVKLGLGFKRRIEGDGKVEVVTRRDRSLGGREVVVERRVVKGGERKREVDVDQEWKAMPIRVRREQQKLARWWPLIGPRKGVETNREEGQRQAKQLIQGWEQLIQKSDTKL